MVGKCAFANAAGEELIEHARQLHTSVERALAAMRRYKDGWLGRVRIGTGDVMLTYFLPPVLRALRTNYPNIELTIFAGATTDVLQRIGRNEIDLGLVTLPVNERVFRPPRFAPRLSLRSCRRSRPAPRRASPRPISTGPT
jgi:DNA-binding transcriptional LysR family regulator